jgi:transcriptional regulator with XRE-family HTH domain
MDTSGIGKRARALRESRGWSLRRAAKACGLSLGTVVGIEAGRTWPHRKTVEAYVRTYGVSEMVLLHGEDRRHA